MTPKSNAPTKARRHGAGAGRVVILRPRAEVLFALGITLAIAAGSTLTVVGQQAPTRQHIETLASEKLDGRLPGPAGERLAADYIVSQLQRIGAKTVPGLADYRVPFEFTSGNRDGGTSLRIQTAKEVFTTQANIVSQTSARESGGVVGGSADVN